MLEQIDADELYHLHTSGGGVHTYGQLAEMYDASYDSVRDKIRRYVGARRHEPTALPAPKFTGVAASSYPQYTSPLRMEAEAAIILPDIEAPYHNAEFLNRCLDLANTWGVKNAILAGDVLHFSQFSKWGAEWKEEKKPGDSLTPETMEALKTRAANNPEVLKILDTIPVDRQENDELAEARRVLETLGGMFDQVDFVLGNHDSRFLKLLNSPLLPRKLLDFVGGCPEPRWRIAPYFYSILVSSGETYRIEHPVSAADNTAVRLSDKYDCNTVVAHAHSWSMRLSTSGRHIAIMAGCCCDELLMEYASQRSTNRPAHSLGAVIVRGGTPYLLHPKTDWSLLKRSA